MRILERTWHCSRQSGTRITQQRAVRRPGNLCHVWHQPSGTDFQPMTCGRKLDSTWQDFQDNVFKWFQN